MSRNPIGHREMWAMPRVILFGGMRWLTEAIRLVYNGPAAAANKWDDISAAMENTSLASDVWDNVTISSSQEYSVEPNLLYLRNFALQIIYAIIGIVGVLDNLFVIIIFIFCVKITDKVLLRSWVELSRV